MMNKANFEKLIKKDISHETFSLYNALWIAYKETVGDEAHKKDFIKLLNIRAIPQDNELKAARQFAKKNLPKLYDKLKALESRKAEVDQMIIWSNKQDFSFVSNYKYEKLQLLRDIKEVKSQIYKLKNSIK